MFFQQIGKEDFRPAAIGSIIRCRLVGSQFTIVPRQRPQNRHAVADASEWRTLDASASPLL
jgi:hypothetical protein